MRHFRVGRRPSAERQSEFGFISRTRRSDRRFRGAIIVITAVVVGTIIGLSPKLRTIGAVSAARARQWGLAAMGLNSGSRPVSDEEWHARRIQKVSDGEHALDKFLSLSSPSVRDFFEATGMGAHSGIHRWGLGDQVFMFSSGVFEPDDEGRSYRLRPNMRSVWLRELTMRGGPHGLLLIPDRPELREAATKAGAIVVESSVQNTNSWGLRGPEPDVNARMRVLALGDSFMQGMFIGDADTPPLRLEEYLKDKWNCSVSVLNTGHVGYGPEQYYYTLQSYLDLFRPHLMVLSVCHNDFGADQEVLSGRGSQYEEAAYWIDRILELVRSRTVPVLIVAVPHREQVDMIRSNGHYPGHLFDFIKLSPHLAMVLVDTFIDENLRLKMEARAKGEGFQSSILYNAEIQDGHFSARGSKIWARSVGERIARMISPEQPGSPMFPTSMRPGRSSFSAK